MPDGSSKPDFAAELRRLQDDPDAVTWPERQALAKSVCTSLSSDGTDEVLQELLSRLADDPKWEIRKVVADGLLHVPDDDFPRLAAKLSADSNSFVRKAADRALDRRRRGQRTAERRRRGLDQVAEFRAGIEKLHGTMAAEKASRMAERMYDLLVGATVHDMRGLMTSLKSNTGALLRHLEDGELSPNVFHEALTKMSGRLDIMESLLDDMRTYAQTTPPERRLERLRDVVNEAHRMACDIFQARNRDISCVATEFDIPENITLEVSRNQIVVAIANVVKNAYESFATHPDRFERGSISFAARLVNDDFAELTVRDTGMGLSEDELSDVRRFVPGGTSKKTHGTGFGLPIAHRKIVDHGGTLQIESTENVGTTVTITLPLEAEGHDVQ